jgi:hypothetical protein
MWIRSHQECQYFSGHNLAKYGAMMSSCVSRSTLNLAGKVAHIRLCGGNCLVTLFLSVNYECILVFSTFHTIAPVFI